MAALHLILFTAFRHHFIVSLANLDAAALTDLRDTMTPMPDIALDPTEAKSSSVFSRLRTVRLPRLCQQTAEQ